MIDSEHPENPPPDALRIEENPSEQDLLLESRADVESAMITLIEHTRHTLRIYSPDLEHAIYNRSPLLDALGLRLTRVRALRLEVLLLDSRKAIAPGHRLIDMARRVGSQFEFRRPRESMQTFKGSVVIADDSGYLLRPRWDRYRGRASLDDPGRSRQLSAWFDEIWQVADPDPETRELHL